MNARSAARVAIAAAILCLAGITAGDELSFPSNQAAWSRALAVPQPKGLPPCAGAKGVCIQPDYQPRAAARVLFETDSARIRGGYNRDLDELGRALGGALADAVLVIEGHADSTGSAAHNLALSTRRAQAVRRYLIGRYAVEPVRLRFEGHGEASPRADNATPAGRRLNRRVEVVRIGSYR